MSVRRSPEPPPTKYGARTGPVQARSAAAGPTHAVLQAKATRQAPPPPPTRFGPVQAAVQAKTGHVPAPPTRFGLPAPAVQAKPVHAPPPSRFAPAGHAALQAKSLRPGPMPPFQGGPQRFRAIQAKITVSAAPPPQFSHDDSRPSSHLNKSTLKALIQDVQTNGAKNAIEQEISTMLGKLTVDQTADFIIQQKWLSANGYDVCHKTPFGSVQQSILALINGQFGKTAAVAGWDKLDDFIKSISGKSSLVSGLKTAATAAAPVAATVAEKANDLLLHFDSLPDNLYFGFATTNRSIGDNADLHYNALSSGSGAEPPTPRGAGALTRLQSFETALGLASTNEVTVIDKSGTWAMTSGAHGKKTDDAGYILRT